MDIELSDLTHALKNGTEQERIDFAIEIFKLPVKHIGLEGEVTYLPIWETLRMLANDPKA